MDAQFTLHYLVILLIQEAQKINFIKFIKEK